MTDHDRIAALIDKLLALDAAALPERECCSCAVDEAHIVTPCSTHRAGRNVLRPYALALKAILARCEDHHLALEWAPQGDAYQPLDDGPWHKDAKEDCYSLCELTEVEREALAAAEQVGREES